MLAAMAGWLAPVPAAIVQEFIDVAVILNALRALTPAGGRAQHALSAQTERELHVGHVELFHSLEQLRSIADALDDATPERAKTLIVEANSLVQDRIVSHERDDEGSVYPKLSKVLASGYGLSAMSRAHREIQHLARLLARVVADLPAEAIDHYLVRDAQRLIEATETLVRIHTAQEDDIYGAVASG
jgi:hypothetical protein